MAEKFSELIAERYSAAAPPELQDFVASNAIIETLLQHKSVRQYKSDPLPPATLETLVAAAQSASTSSNLQPWSIVSLQDPARKAEAATLCADQEFIRQAPLLLIFCADLARLTWVSQQQGLAGEGLKYTELFLIAAIDTALAAQNASIAAESLGLGICYIGAARNRPRELAELLNLPPRVIALFGLTVGWPQDGLTTSIKPRLPQPGLLHHETYQTQDWDTQVAAYDEAMRYFYDAQRLDRNGPWAHHASRRVATKEALGGRHILRDVLEERGFELQ